MGARRRIVGAGLIIILGWLFLAPPGEVPLTPACEANGVTNRLRAVVQGERFWHSVGVMMERQQARGGASALGECRATIFRRAGMDVRGALP